MKYYCSGCSYIYNEILGDIDLGIKPFTFFESLPNDFFCPYCDTHKDDFILLDEVINYPINTSYLTSLEAEHYPIYEISGDVFKFEIGQIEHSNQEDHFIYKVGLFDEYGDMIDKKNFHIGKEPKGEFDIEYLNAFEIRVFCSKHGIFSTGLIQLH